MPANTALRLVEPRPKRATPLRKPNSELRTREHLTEAEVERLIAPAKRNRHGHRDATMILVAFRHGFRVSLRAELFSLARFLCSRPAPRLPESAITRYLSAYLLAITAEANHSPLSPDLAALQLARPDYCVSGFSAFETEC